MPEVSRWWRPRFRLASLLWLTLCTALAIGMYRYGYQSGHEAALNQRTFVGTTNPRLYDVAKIVPLKQGKDGGAVADFDSLMKDLKNEVLPYTWDDRGGAAVMAEYPPNLSLVISHDEDGHERIAAWLKKREQRLAQSETPTVGSIAADAADRRN